MTTASQSLSDSYRWDVPGKISVCLDYAVVDRLLAEVMRGFGAIPRRGAEVGGILIGSIERTAAGRMVRIEDFEPVPCDHRRGPSFLLSEPDAARFTETVTRLTFSPEKKSYAVGLYRSHTREGMGMTTEDLALLDHYLTDPSAVFLLVKPYATKVSVGGFFFREPDSSIRAESSYQEFPFRRKELGGGSSPAAPRGRERGAAPQNSLTESDGEPDAGHADGRDGRGDTRERSSRHSSGQDYSPPEFYDPATAPATAEELQAALASVPVPGAAADTDSAVSRFRRTNVWIPLSFIFLLLGVLVGFQAAIAYRPSRAAGVLNDAYTLALAVGRTGDNLHVRWDRNSHAVRVAQRGVLTIIDGTYSTTVDLDVAQLQNPSVFYRNMSTTVRFRLEVFTKERNSVAEVLEWSK